MAYQRPSDELLSRLDGQALGALLSILVGGWADNRNARLSTLARLSCCSRPAKQADPLARRRRVSEPV